MTFSEGPLHERSDVVVQAPATTVVEVPADGQVIVPAAPVSGGQVRKAYASHFAPDAIIAAIAGLVILVVGLIAVVRGGFDGQMSDPVVQVVGFTHTTVLGLIEIAIGAALLISGATRSRSGAVLFGSALGIAGFVGAVQTKSFTKSLALESSMAWLAVLVAVVVVLAALMMPRFNRQSTVIERI
jgi:asparagine N-glycosylation enzyme membrane subunit Stt3